MSKDRIRGTDAATACECEVEAAAHAVAFDRSKGRRRKDCDCMHQPLPRFCKFERVRSGECGNLVEVGSGGEEMLIAGDDERLRIDSLGEFLDLRSQFADCVE